MKIQILGTGCPKCKALFENTKKAVKELNLDCEVEKVENIDDIINMGIMITPALVLDNKVKISGKVPSVEEIKSIMES
jgi:small redox-active disulfide protein 2